MEHKLILLGFLMLLNIQIFAQSGIGEKTGIGSDSSRDKTVSQEIVTEPFSWGDFTWLQGNNRQHNALLNSQYFTGTLTMDGNFNYSFNRPKDHTNVGSTATFRTGEYNLSYIEAGGDFHYENVHARMVLQFGSRATGIPRNDNTPLRGQFDLYTALRFVTEGYAGTHLDYGNGVNIDIGIFKSYVGLLSYNNFENWNYQPSYTSDNTPWFFTGVRIQTFPSDRLKIEYWIVNGWQTYGMYNDVPGLGYQVLWRPNECLSLVFNGYEGYDTPANPDRWRVHSDNSVQVKYFQDSQKFITKAALSLTGDVGFETGGGVSAFGGNNGPAQNFFSGMIYNRLWFAHDHFGWTIGGGFMHNPGRYLVLLPTGAAATSFTQNPGDKFDAWDFSTTLQYMPNEYSTWFIELVHREANVPYFAGRGGVTSENGYNAPLGNPTGFQPDLVKNETRLICGLLVRF